MKSYLAQLCQIRKFNFILSVLYVYDNLTFYGQFLINAQHFFPNCIILILHINIFMYYWSLFHYNNSYMNNIYINYII